MRDLVLKTIRRHRMIQPGDRIAVACSGGADSTALLLLLYELAPELGCVLSATHFNHCLRGAESEQDETFVRALAGRLDLPFHAERSASVHAGASNLEAKARRERYDFFRALTQSGKADRVATAHTADDQAETVLQRLLRGAGPTGLAGIHPVLHSGIIRPLLTSRRSTLRQWLMARSQTWREDSSNADTRFLRNRLRTEILPRLAPINPQIVENLCRTAGIAREDEEFWREYLRPLLKSSVQEKDGQVRVDRQALRRLPRAAAQRLLRAALAAVPANQARNSEKPGTILPGTVCDQPTPGGSAHIEQLLDWALNPQSGGEMRLPPKITAQREFQHLILVSGAPALPARFCYPVAVPAVVSVPETGSTFYFQLVALAAKEARYNGAEDCILLDSRICRLSLQLRNWQPGDLFQPAGQRQSRKLQDLFQRRRISRADRVLWPVLADDDRVIWARGWPAAEGFAPAPGSVDALQMRESRWEGAQP